MTWVNQPGERVERSSYQTFQVQIQNNIVASDEFITHFLLLNIELVSFREL